MSARYDDAAAFDRYNDPKNWKAAGAPIAVSKVDDHYEFGPMRMTPARLAVIESALVEEEGTP